MARILEVVSAVRVRMTLGSIPVDGEVRNEAGRLLGRLVPKDGEFGWQPAVKYKGLPLDFADTHRFMEA